jgi:AcrR family transcriptional regulator
MAHELNETRQRLIDATSELMDELSLEEISAALVLERTGASKSSMYHFFEDFSELLEESFLVRFAASVEASGRAIKDAIKSSTTQEGFFNTLEAVTKSSQARNGSPIRFQRARMLARCERNDRFRKSLGEIQENLTDFLAEAFEMAQQKGFVNHDFEPRTGAVFIQAYTLGKLVDDITQVHMDDADWERLIGAVLRQVFGAK